MKKDIDDDGDPIESLLREPITNQHHRATCKRYQRRDEKNRKSGQLRHQCLMWMHFIAQQLAIHQPKLFLLNWTRFKKKPSLASNATNASSSPRTLPRAKPSSRSTLLRWLKNGAREQSTPLQSKLSATKSFAILLTQDLTSVCSPATLA